MTDNIRKVGRFIVLAFLMLMLAIFVIGAISVGGSAVAAYFQGDGNMVPILVCLLIVMAGFLIFLAWLGGDAKEAAQDLRKIRKTEADANEDMSAVAGVPQREPWLG